MLDDFLISPYCVAVEWPERIADWLPADAGISSLPSWPANATPCDCGSSLSGLEMAFRCGKMLGVFRDGPFPTGC